MHKFISLVFFCFLSSGILFSQQFNRYDKNGLRTGKWLTYSDSDKKLKLFDGKYRKGIAVGTCYYYSMTGILEKKEVKRFRKLKTTLYYPNQNKRSEGRARIENLPDKIHYYFYGKWKYYDENGNLVKYCYYKKGEIVKTEYINKSNKTNDSLIFALNKIEKDFSENNKDLMDSISLSIFNPKKCERLKLKLFQLDSVPFNKIEWLLGLYGYPSKEVGQEACNIPFFIMSFAPLKLREKHLELFKAAAGIGSISAASLAFYIDKIKISKGEKQIYGTQYYYDKDKQIKVYSCEDPDNLEKRRKEVGLEKLPY